MIQSSTGWLITGFCFNHCFSLIILEIYFEEHWNSLQAEILYKKTNFDQKSRT